MPRTFHRLKGGKVDLAKGQFNKSHTGSCNGRSHHRSHPHGNLQQQVSPPHHQGGHLHDGWRAATKNLRSWGPTKILQERRTDHPKVRHSPCLKENKKNPPNEADIAKGVAPGGSSQEKEDKVQKTGHQLPEAQLKGKVYTHQGRLEGFFGTKKTLSTLAFPD